MFIDTSRSVLLSLLKEIGNEIPSSYQSIQASEYGILKPIDIDIKNDTVRDVIVKSQFNALIKKNPWVFDNDDGRLRDTTFSTFLQAEQQCKITNTHFLKGKEYSFHFRSVLETARHYVQKILGEFCYSTMEFGPGSSMKQAGKDSNLIRKLTQLPEVTPNCHDLVLFKILDEMPHYAISSGICGRSDNDVWLQNRHLPTVPGNRLEFVPKDSQKHRPICIEPIGNMLLQKGIGLSIKERLKKYGYNLGKTKSLTDIQYSPSTGISEIEIKNSPVAERHREIVKQASKDNLLATIDLSNASDTISLEFVRFMLPDDWFQEMEKVRSRFTRIPKDLEKHVVLTDSFFYKGNQLWMRNEKFSSMGNGFTFELETLLFLSLLLSCRYHYGNKSDFVSAFGDDMILPTEYAPQCIELLEACGFSVNHEKSFFTDSFFRESCGADFFHGVNVRPIFIKDCRIDDKIQHKIALCNRIFEIADHLYGGLHNNSSFLNCWKTIVNSIPKYFRLFGPPYSDDMMIYSFNQNLWLMKYENHTCSILCLHEIRWEKEKCTTDYRGYSAFLYGVPSNGISFRDSKVSLKRKWRPLIRPLLTSFES